jgi:WD40 repeat protein
MELGTQDIFLEKKKKGGQQEGGGVLDIAAALAKGLTKDQKRTAIINVSKKVEDIAALQLPSSPRLKVNPNADDGGQGGQDASSSRSVDAIEPLDDLIGLPELRHIVGCFVNFFGPMAEPTEISFHRRMSRLQMKLDEVGDGTSSGIESTKQLRVRQIRMAALNALTSTYAAKTGDYRITRQELETMVTLPPIHPSMKLRLNQQQFVRTMRGAFREKLNESYQAVASNAFSSSPLRGTGDQTSPKTAASLASSLRDEDFILMFQNIDHEKNGTIDWDDFTSYLMLQTRDRSRANKASSEYSSVATPASCPIWYQHEGAVTCMLVHPRTGVVLTGGEDGAVHAWDGISLRHLKLFTQCKSWVVDMKFTNNEQKILVVCLDRQLLILDSRNGDVLRLYRGRHLVETDTGVNYAHESIPVVTIGERVPSYLQPRGAKVGANRSEDARKSALMAQMKTALSYDQYQKLLTEEKKNRTEKRKLEEFALAGMTDTPSCLEYHCSQHGEEFVLIGMSNGSVRLYIIPVSHLRIVRKHYVMQLHSDRVRKLQVIPFLDGLMSCSDDGTILLTSLETGQLLKSYTKNGHQSSVLSFSFSLKYKMMVSCAAERGGLVWDYLQESPVARLEPHTCPLLGCSINDADGHIITVGVDNSVMIFDVRSCRLLQTFHERTNLFSACIFDTNKMRLVCATSFPCMYQLKKMISTFPQDYFGHTAPVQFALYNSAYEQLLTIDTESLAMTWKADLGETVYTFRLTAFSSMLDDVRLTLCVFDKSRRRLITGFHNGVIGVWNYSNGQAQNLIRSVKVDEATEREVTALATLERGDTTFFFGAVGRLLVYQEESQQYTITESPTWLLDEALGSITALVQVGTSLVACGTSSGAVVIFSILTGGQDGNVLWPDEDHPDRDSSSAGHSSTTNSAGLSRVTHLFSFAENKPFKRLFFSVHADGKIALWHTFRRMFLSQEFIGHRNASVSITHVVHTESENFITVGDEIGNIFIWEYTLSETSEEEIGAVPRHDEQLSEDATPYRISSMTVRHRFHSQTNTIMALEVMVLSDGVFIVISQMNNLTRIFDTEGACMGEFGFSKWRSLVGSPRRAPVSPIAIEIDRHESSSQYNDIPAFLTPVTPQSGKRRAKKASSSSPQAMPDMTVMPPSPKCEKSGGPENVPSFSLIAPSPASKNLTPCPPQISLSSVQMSPRIASPMMIPSRDSNSPSRPLWSECDGRGAKGVQPPESRGGARRSVRVGGPKVRDGIVKKSLALHGGSFDAETSTLSAVPSMDMPSLRRGSSFVGPPAPGGSGGSGNLSTSSNGPKIPSAPSAAAPTAVLSHARIPQVASQQEKSALLAIHLQTQLGRLRSCKTNLAEELKRVELRIQATHRHDESLTSAREDGDVIAQLPWTSRVSSRLHVTKIDEIRPPEGSKAYEEENRRNARLRAADDGGGGGGKGSKTGGEVRSDMFPSVTAPNAS